MGFRVWHKRIPAVLTAGIILLSAALPVCGRSLIVGIVPQFETGRLYAVWRPITQALSRQTGYGFSLAGSPSIAAFERAFMKGEYDIAYMNPYHYIVAARTQGYIPIVRDVGRSLTGVLVVAKDSGISGVAQLMGKTIAFPSPNALGASLQMRQELHDLFDLSFFPKYVKTHDSVYLNVILGETAAGGGVQKTLDRQPSHYREKLTVIHATRPVAPHPVVVHPRIAPEVRRRIQQALLAMGQTPEGIKMLSGIPIRKIGIAVPEDYAPLREMKLERFYVPPEK